jgi:hypothetical protein
MYNGQLFLKGESLMKKQTLHWIGIVLIAFSWYSAMVLSKGRSEYRIWV